MSLGSLFLRPCDEIEMELEMIEVGDGCLHLQSIPAVCSSNSLACDSTGSCTSREEQTCAALFSIHCGHICMLDIGEANKGC